MSVDAIILAGGRSSRLGGVAKATLLHDGRTLLQLAIDAAQIAGGRIVVVGPEIGSTIEAGSTIASVRFVREHPLFGGPAAAIAAGLDALLETSESSRGVAVLACDMPLAAPALAAVLAAAEPELAAPDADTADEPTHGWIAIDDDGHEQPLLAVYRQDALRRRLGAVAAERPSGDVSGASVRQLIGGLHLRHVPVSAGGSADVDTWADAAELGVVAPAVLPAPAAPSAPTAPSIPTTVPRSAS